MGRSLAATDVNGIFSRNLQQLVADQPSISSVCRTLGINRTQFNRYLSGEAHPRPEVLARMCSHFGCDGRILLTPLDEIRRQQAESWPFPPDPDPFLVYRTGFDHVRMPDGLYQIILPNMVQPGAVVIELIRLFTTRDGVKGMHWGIHKPYAESIGMSTRWRDRKQTGFVQQHTDGVSLLAANPLNRLLILCFVTFGFRGNPTVHTGFAAMTQAAGPMQSQVQPLILKKLPEDCGAVLRARRSQRGFRLDMLPTAQRAYFETWRVP